MKKSNDTDSKDLQKQFESKGEYTNPNGLGMVFNAVNYKIVAGDCEDCDAGEWCQGKCLNRFDCSLWLGTILKKVR